VAAVHVNEPRMDASRRVDRNVPNHLEHSPAAGHRHCHLVVLVLVLEPSAPNIRHSQPAPNGAKTRSGGAEASGADVTDPQVLTITRAEASHPRNGHTGLRENA
jgi:hypothetical protein